MNAVNNHTDKDVDKANREMVKREKRVLGSIVTQDRHKKANPVVMLTDYILPLVPKSNHTTKNRQNPVLSPKPGTAQTSTF